MLALTQVHSHTPRQTHTTFTAIWLYSHKAAVIFLQAAHTGRNARFRSFTCVEQWWQISQLWKQCLIQKDRTCIRAIWALFCQLHGFVKRRSRLSLHCFLFKMRTLLFFLLKSQCRHNMLNFEYLKNHPTNIQSCWILGYLLNVVM